jgi:type 2 lantibiotic biosynthesis protein LanM
MNYPNHNTEYLQAADRIGRRLCRDAVWAGSRCNWLGWSMEAMNGSWAPAWRALGSELYGGTAGVALFLARLWQITGDAVERSTLIGALNQALEGAAGIDPLVKTGFYSGASGIGYALIEAGTILEHEEMVQRGIAELISLRNVSLDQRMVDVISGSAGAISVLLDIGGRFGRDELIETARIHGNHLLALAHKSEEGWSWDTMQIAGQKNLTGYSHGTAGIAHALLELHRKTGEAPYLEAAREGLRYERASFSPAHRNWPDFRKMDPTAADSPPVYMTAWCHGAPGIGMSRLRVRELLHQDPVVSEEVEFALQTTAAALAQPVGPGMGNYSLCHGSCGNAELMIMAADRLGRRDLRQPAETLGQIGLEHCSRTDQPWACGVQNAGETPGLLLGLAGIGYFYLRLYDSRAVPSVLVYPHSQN